VAFLAEIALNETPPAAAGIGDKLSATPRCRDVGVISEVVPQLRAVAARNRYDHLEVAVVPVGEVALDNDAGA